MVNSVRCSGVSPWGDGDRHSGKVAREMRLINCRTHLPQGISKGVEKKTLTCMIQALSLM